MGEQRARCDTAIAQARSARDAAIAANRQATAAEEQVNISRKQFEAELADRNETEGPVLALENVIERWPGERFVTATPHDA